VDGGHSICSAMIVNMQKTNIKRSKETTGKRRNEKNQKNEEKNENEENTEFENRLTRKHDRSSKTKRKI
jgi:hypothetical protein